MVAPAVADVNSSRIRSAGRELLSLALMDARNRTLRWLAVFEEAQALAVPFTPDIDPPLWLAGHVGWFQERWIARNVQRQRGASADAGAARLASIDREADAAFDPAQVRAAQRFAETLPDADHARGYLADTMEVTLELLESAAETDDALYFFRLALFHEDWQAERFAEAAQTLGVSLGAASGLVAELGATPPREPLVFPAMRWSFGASPQGGGFVVDNEKWAHDVALPEFEIDAQPVTWAQYVEFVEDGGYDEPHWWGEAGWRWLQQDGRRVPRHVEQMRQGVLQQRFGRSAHVPLGQPALHLSWHEADAWCRWAGRRLPTEVEWEAAAATGRSRGLVWGGVREWTASTLRPYPGFAPDAWDDFGTPAFAAAPKVLRGASFAMHPRLHDVKLRGFAPATRDTGFTGFRSCSL